MKKTQDQHKNKILEGKAWNESTSMIVGTRGLAAKYLSGMEWSLATMLGRIECNQVQRLVPKLIHPIKKLIVAQWNNEKRLPYIIFIIHVTEV